MTANGNDDNGEERDYRNAHDERSPLLSMGEQPAEDISRRRYLEAYIIFFCIFLIVLIEIGVYLQAAPMTRIMEDIICRGYYTSLGDADAPDEERCKIEPVQSELAMLRGWQRMFDCIPTILLAMPYGFLGDTKGRRLALGLSLLGATLAQAWIQLVCWFPDTFDIHLTWLSSLFMVIGDIVAASMVFTVVADVTTEEQRTTVFFRIATSVLAAEIVATPLASLAMQTSPWIPVNIGLAGIALGTILTFTMLPETLHLKEKPVAAQSLTGTSENPDGPSGNHGSLLKQVEDGLASLSKAFGFIWSSRNVAILVVTFFTSTFAKQCPAYLLQYVSKKYSWSLAKTGFLMSYRAMVNFVALVVLLPGLGYLLLRRFHGDIRHKDLWLTRLSISLLTLGLLIISLAPVLPIMVIGLTLYALGYGFPYVLRSLATSMVESHHVAMLYNAIAMSDAAGTLISGPMLSGALQAGMKLGGPWIGLPFLIVAVLCGVSLLAVTVGIRLSTVEVHREEVDPEDEDAIV